MLLALPHLYPCSSLPPPLSSGPCLVWLPRPRPRPLGCPVLLLPLSIFYEYKVHMYTVPTWIKHTQCIYPLSQSLLLHSQFVYLPFVCFSLLCRHKYFTPIICIIYKHKRTQFAYSDLDLPLYRISFCNDILNVFYTYIEQLVSNFTE